MVEQVRPAPDPRRRPEKREPEQCNQAQPGRAARGGWGATISSLARPLARGSRATAATAPLFLPGPRASRRRATQTAIRTLEKSRRQHRGRRHQRQLRRRQHPRLSLSRREHDHRGEAALVPRLVEILRGLLDRLRRFRGDREIDRDLLGGGEIPEAAGDFFRRLSRKKKIRIVNLVCRRRWQRVRKGAAEREEDGENPNEPALRLMRWAPVFATPPRASGSPARKRIR